MESARLSKEREALLRLAASRAENRDEILTAADAYEAKIVDYMKDSIIFQVTGDSRKIDQFINLMRDFNILEICRTGIVSLERGESTIRKVTNL